LNLSQPDLFIETFGLTVLEAMTYGIPVIVPDAGGITGLVEHGVNGFRVDTSKPEEVLKTIVYVFADQERYHKLSESARARSRLFSYSVMMDRILEVTG
jgi:glycosyltransferase involved in cell wall biosynthesis